MTTAALKKKIKALVDKTTSEKKLGKVYEVLSEQTKAEAVQRRMQEVAEESEKDIRAGRTVSLDEFMKDSDAYVKELFKERGAGRAASSTSSMQANIRAR